MEAFSAAVSSFFSSFVVPVSFFCSFSKATIAALASIIDCLYFVSLKLTSGLPPPMRTEAAAGEDCDAAAQAAFRDSTRFQPFLAAKETIVERSTTENLTPASRAS